MTKTNEGTFAKLIKKNIEPLTVTVTFTVGKVNEHGTLSDFDVTHLEVKNHRGKKIDVSPINHFKTPHSLMLRVDTLDGIAVRETVDGATGTRPKLF